MICVTHRTLIFCTWGARGAYAVTSLTDQGVLHVEPVTDTAVQVVEYGDNHIILASRPCLASVEVPHALPVGTMQI